MNRVKISWALWTFISLLKLDPIPLVAQTDCSAAHCVDCKQNDLGIASCIPVSYDAHCSCSIEVGSPQFCILDGACDYGGGGGNGGGGGDGGGGGCFRLPGQWCPAECDSCGTIFWY